ncbi:MAG: PIG-L deacetylase family protein [Actinomycetota bacterium]|nr:PIG-L deacetylase family protein [Actinomycetota bacterium]
MLGATEIDRLLVVMAHPDDVDFGSAGTIATLAAAGVHVTYCLVTDGDAGGSDRTISRTEMASMRRKEQTAAAAAVGVHDLIFLGHPDGRVVADLALRRDVSRVIRQVRPTVVLGQSPERNLDRIFASHPDHLAAGEATVCAVYPDARNPFAFPELLEEGLEPWSVRELWISGHPTITDVVDVTEQIDRKFEALLCHASQHPDPDTMQVRVRAWMAATAHAHGLAEGRYAEGYRVVANL